MSFFLLAKKIVLVSYLFRTSAFRVYGVGASSRLSVRRIALRASDSSGHADKLPFPAWLHIVFQGQSVSPLYVDPKCVDEILNTKQDAGCIIDDPIRAMGHPMIDFDIEKASQQVLETSKERPDPRLKPVVAIARGKGGGKTRAMEEVRRYLMRRKTTLPIAITYNSQSAIARDPWLKQQTCDAYSLDRVYALSVSARMLSAVFGVSFSETAELIRKNLGRLDWESVDAPTMIQETLKFVLQRTNEARVLSSIDLVDTFVLLMDENAKADNEFDKTDLGAIVRQALLDKSINAINIALVISDLGFLPETLRTDSDRTVKVLVL